MKVFAANSHPGRKRDHNEDCYRADAELGLWLVADGVGGHANGEVASRIVGDTLVQQLTEGKSLADGIIAAHRAVLQEIESRDSSNMGSTVVAFRLQGDDYEIGWVGDSRAYLYDGGIKQLSRDHNPVNELLARGAITAEQAAAHPERHVLSQSLGVSDSIKVSPGKARGKLRPGQQILLCSDGLTDELGDAQIASILAAKSTTQEQVDGLIEAALQAGGRDNVTVVLVGEAVQGKQPARAPSEHVITREMVVVTQPDADFETESHDSKVLLLLSIMGALAVLWVLLKIF